MLAAVMMVSVIGIMPESVSAAEKSIASKGGSVAITDAECSYATSEYTWIQYTPKADGYIKLTFAPNSAVVSYPEGTAQLYNKTKSKALSDVFSFFTDDNRQVFKSDYYGVKKKTTYYIRVTSYGGVNVNIKFVKFKDKSGTKQSKAITLKKGKQTTGVMTAGSNKAHWYKFNMSKPSKLSFFITPFTTGDVSVTLKGPGSNNTISGTVRCRSYQYNYDGSVNVTGNYWGRKYTCYESSRLHRTGMYYVQIKPTTKTGTGYYKISWK